MIKFRAEPPNIVSILMLFLPKFFIILFRLKRSLDIFCNKNLSPPQKLKNKSKKMKKIHSKREVKGFHLFRKIIKKNKLEKGKNRLSWIVQWWWTHFWVLKWFCLRWRIQWTLHGEYPSNKTQRLKRKTKLTNDQLFSDLFNEYLILSFFWFASHYFDFNPFLFLSLMLKFVTI